MYKGVEEGAAKTKGGETPRSVLKITGTACSYCVNSWSWRSGPRDSMTLSSGQTTLRQRARGRIYPSINEQNTALYDRLGQKRVARHGGHASPPLKFDQIISFAPRLVRSFHPPLTPCPSNPGGHNFPREPRRNGDINFEVINVSPR